MVEMGFQIEHSVSRTHAPKHFNLRPELRRIGVF